VFLDQGLEGFLEVGGLWIGPHFLSGLFFHTVIRGRDEKITSVATSLGGMGRFALGRSFVLMEFEGSGGIARSRRSCSRRGGIRRGTGGNEARTL